MKAVLILSLSLLQLQEANHTDDYFILKAPIHELLMPDGTTTENNIHEDLLFISTVGKISANPPVFICVDYERANINIDDEKYTPCITAEATKPNCEDRDVHTGVANKKAAGKLKRIKVKQNETARVLAGIGAFTCILLFIQIVVLAMSIKLIKRQVIRDL
ncbi:unnamed protein product [Nippostrongylus brasiliensis]|uniref:ZP domain-containing protein n=1 Tax=Nippostrongylus brasiliensis TaxID=27835 RepID=A0A0N4Y468_NIPBR|nr:unnamed protein product [Nippostrongylus brasiliensis]